MLVVNLWNVRGKTDKVVQAAEQEMATYSSVLSWRVLWTGEPGGLLSMGSHRVGHDWSDLACMHALEKEIATYSSILSWRIPGMEEPGGLLSMGLHRVGHDWSDLACMHALKKEMATHSSILAWGIPGTAEPGGLPSMWSHRVGHDWRDLAAGAAALWWLCGSGYTGEVIMKSLRMESMIGLVL